MSTVSALSQSSFQFIQGIASRPKGLRSQASQANSQQGASGVQGAGRRPFGGAGGGGLFDQIQSAVTSALDAAQSSGSTTDPNQIVEQAIAGVLKSSGKSAASVGGDPDNDGDTDGAGSTEAAEGTSSSQSSRQSFFQLLQSAGIDAKQFKQDFLAAVKDAQGGNANPSTAFKSLPPGSVINTVA